MADPTTPPPSPDLLRFIASLDPDPQEAWHDGTGYDMAALRALAPAERDIALARLTARRECSAAAVEVFGEIGTPAAIAEVQRCARDGTNTVRFAAAKALGRLQGDPDAASRWLVALFDDPRPDVEGFMQMTAYLPGEVKQADTQELRAAMRGCAERGSPLAPYAAAMVLELAGLSATTWAWGTFPFLNKLDSAEATVRQAAIDSFRGALARHGTI